MSSGQQDVGADGDDLAANAIERVAAVIARLWDDGCPIASRPDAMAVVAIRRWQSARRRGVKPSDVEGHIRDLTKGLIAHFETDPSHVGPLSVDYEHVARAASEVLANLGGG